MCLNSIRSAPITTRLLLDNFSQFSSNKPITVKRLASSPVVYNTFRRFFLSNRYQCSISVYILLLSLLLVPGRKVFVYCTVMDKIIAQHRHQSSSGYSMYQVENMDLDSRMLSPNSSSNESSQSSSYRKSNSSSSSFNRSSSNGTMDSNNRRQEDRLLRNRSAAKECRLKKKEYVKCLEKRLKILEDQNKQLIDQVKYLLHIVRSNSMTAAGSTSSSNDNENSLTK